MLRVTPRSWFSNTYLIAEDGVSVAALDLAVFREAATLLIDREEYRLYREGWASGDFVLERNGAVVARATKPSAFRNLFEIEYNGQRFTLQRESAWRREFGLYRGEGRIGALAPESTWSRVAQGELPADLPLAVRAFMIWLMVVIWRRDDSAAASAAS
jgi:hypothetical protein